MIHASNLSQRAGTGGIRANCVPCPVFIEAAPGITSHQHDRAGEGQHSAQIPQGHMGPPRKSPTRWHSPASPRPASITGVNLGD